MFNAILYVEIDVFAALVLLIIMDHSRTRLMTTAQKLFRAELISIIVVLLFDAATWALNETTFPGARALSLLCNYLYWLATLLPCYIGLLYCLCVCFERLNRTWATILALPILAGFVLLLLNLYDGWIFTVSDRNVYARGPYFLAVGALPFIHMAAAVIVTFGRFLHAQVYERKKYLMLTMFMLMPLAGALLQILYYGLVTVWIGLTLCMLMCYVNIQNGNLSLDPLTGLNNRGRFDAYSAWQLKTLKPASTLFLIMLDIDRFKSINDTQGHAEGDRALVRAADILKAAMAGEKGFLARIGGDEFAILFHDTDEPKVRQIVERIRTLAEQSNRSARARYTLSFSMGYAGVTGENKTTFRKLFSQADQNMYRQKRQRAQEAP